MFAVEVDEGASAHIGLLGAAVHLMDVAGIHGDRGASRQLARPAAAIDVAAYLDGLCYAK